MDRFDGINGTKTCKVHAQTLVSSVSHKIAAKMSYSLSNITSSPLLTKTQLSLIHNLLATYNVDPLGIPESLAYKVGIPLLNSLIFSMKFVFRSDFREILTTFLISKHGEMADEVSLDHRPL